MQLKLTEQTMNEDLSNYNAPISDFFQAPTTEEEWDQYRLSKDQINFFHEFGYLSGIQILNDSQIEKLCEELTEITNPNHPRHHLFYEFHSNESEDPTKILFHALGAWRLTPGFHDILWHPQFVMAASQLLGGDVRFWHDQLFCKPAHHGGVVAWHQDYSYWTRTQPLAHLTCWIGLDDATQENGYLHYIPKSHCWPDLPKVELAGNMEAIQSILTDVQKNAFNPIAIELKKGQCTFHHPRMIHGSYTNMTEHPRRATVINIFKDGVCSASDQPLLQGVPTIATGVKVAGKFFPKLFPL